MKKVLFGIALILFALLLFLMSEWIPSIGEGVILLVGLAGVVIAGIGAFTKDK